jgi:hypothetical protein
MDRHTVTKAIRCPIDLQPPPPFVLDAVMPYPRHVRASGRRSGTDARDGSVPAAQCLARYASFVNPASIPGPPRAWTRRLLRCGVAAGPVFVAVFLAEGAVRDPCRHRPQSGGSPGVRRPARRRAGQRLAVLAGRPAPLRPVQASPGSPPCPRKRSGERPPPQHHAARQAERSPDHPKRGIIPVIGDHSPVGPGIVPDMP